MRDRTAGADRAPAPFAQVWLSRVPRQPGVPATISCRWAHGTHEWLLHDPWLGQQTGDHDLILAPCNILLELLKRLQQLGDKVSAHLNERRFGTWRRNDDGFALGALHAAVDVVVVEPEFL